MKIYCKNDEWYQTVWKLHGVLGNVHAPNEANLQIGEETLDYHWIVDIKGFRLN